MLRDGNEMSRFHGHCFFLFSFFIYTYIYIYIYIDIESVIEWTDKRILGKKIIFHFWNCANFPAQYYIVAIVDVENIRFAYLKIIIIRIIIIIIIKRTSYRIM